MTDRTSNIGAENKLYFMTLNVSVFPQYFTSAESPHIFQTGEKKYLKVQKR